MSGIPKSVRADFSERCGGSICFRVHFFVFINGSGNRQYLPVSERRVILIARVGEQQRRRRRRRRHCRTDRNSIATDANRATPPMSAAAAAAAVLSSSRLGLARNGLRYITARLSLHRLRSFFLCVLRLSHTSVTAVSLCLLLRFFSLRQL